MSEFDAIKNLNKRTGGILRSHKLSTRVDLTPMVDLGFLLITFFIFSTTISQPAAMNLILPDEKGDPMPAKESGALTIIPGADQKVYYYEGKLREVKLKSTSLKALRDIIISKKKGSGEDNMFVIIKPSKLSNFVDIVNVLDEMIINDIKRYALVDITEHEEALLQ